ncbi:carboxypeptidase regulatory-like domain-containing protein [Chryseobacterium sp. LC2016-29]|uniref:carboxypeptidase regulatory-like domain-containing protein n=1 Tax=Chryseobacterium sp. LC2016-29 TaxID=2897331 RepID=UPI001E42EEF5|nr:carboxypeptidase regulatory-like domain-containing protein [Chryseobacterium sp. LC2016-29]MCD0479609.1 carboxypeptidase regulatory-like domain-containing protein [Chryseobacterium sp. LC2016-29]
MMRKNLAVFFFFLTIYFFGQHKITGKTLSENDMIVASVLVVNISNDQKVYSNSLGEFSIEGTEKDEIRFIKKGYERASRKVSDVESSMNVILVRIPEEIEEVEIISTTGDLAKDSKRLTKIDKREQLQKDIGLPKPPEKPREVPAEVKKVLLAAAFGNVNVQAVYDLISGKSRRQKRWYKYEDVQDDILWIRKRIDDDDFVKDGIPVERISEFLEFSFIIKPEIRSYVKAKNISRVMFNLDEVIPFYVDRLKTNNNTVEKK